VRIVPRTVELDEFAGQATALIDAVAGGEESVVVVRSGTPIAMLTSIAAHRSRALLADLPRWEEWVHEVRESAAEVAGRPIEPHVQLPGPPEVDKAMLGFEPSTGAIGSPAGRDHLAAELARLDVPVTDESLLNDVYVRVLDLCEAKEHLYEPDLRVLAQEMIATAPQRLRLLAVTVTSSTGLPATAEVTLELGQGPAMRREHGDGPLDAAFKAIQRLTQLAPTVENFSVVAATPGGDAVAEAMIELTLDGRRAVGSGASTNAIEAGIHAYVNALNFLMELGVPA
jgi:antitoxin (DNA-binding transcriptional repressor) of toxin-antitoxin stability system